MAPRLPMTEEDLASKIVAKCPHHYSSIGSAIGSLTNEKKIKPAYLAEIGLRFAPDEHGAVRVYPVAREEVAS